MPSSGTLFGATVEGSEESYLDWQVASQNTAENYSVINWQAGWRFDAYSCRGLRQGDAKVNGTTVYHNFNSGDGVHAYNSGHNHRPGTGKLQTASGAIWVYHNADGTKTMSLSISMVGYSGQTSSASGSASLPTIPRNPGAPTTPVISEIEQTSVRLDWSPNGSDGLPNTGYTISYGTATDATGSTTTSGVTNKTITGLTPGVKYYFKVKATNAVGDGPYSSISNATTIAGAYIKSGDSWVRAIPYVRDGGVWKLARPYAKILGEWKKSTN